MLRLPFLTFFYLGLPHDILGDIEKASNEARKTKANDCAQDLALKKWGRSTPSIEALENILHFIILRALGTELKSTRIQYSPHES